jgi:hypothetical protein
LIAGQARPRDARRQRVRRKGCDDDQGAHRYHTALRFRIDNVFQNRDSLILSINTHRENSRTIGRTQSHCHRRFQGVGAGAKSWFFYFVMEVYRKNATLQYASYETQRSRKPGYQPCFPTT